MVKLSAATVTVDESESYDVDVKAYVEPTESGNEATRGSGGNKTVCGIPAYPVKILLTKDMSSTTRVDSYQEGANVDAWRDMDGTVFVLIDDGGDVCFLEPEEYESLEDGDVVDDGDDADANEVPAEEATTVETTTWEADALADIKRARFHVAQMEGRYLEAKERAKDAKSNWETAVNELTEVIDAATKPMPLFDRKPFTSSQPPETQEQPGVDSDDPADADTRDRWRAISISEICKGVKGLGAKKLEALCEAVPTLGAFEDLRAKASVEGNPLRQYMPAGIGEAACDQLEEAALNRISREYGGDGDDDD